LHGVGKDPVAAERDGGGQSGLVLEVVGGRGVRHTGPAGEVTQADGDGALGGDDLHGGVDDGASEIAVVVTALTGHVDKSSGPSGGCPGARPSTTAERPDRVMTVRKRFRDGRSGEGRVGEESVV